ncbi:hypothetical protein EVAR_6194_1 [Eumeta japonica]|uniref:Uncharacterized protein n=1 Tax=Eumeta variegata TaxID=151549 RepID=A0A4C2A388_EUMVA|nr:hypothetical protein EVAR_6194_1 [Eumeta japonica]
MIGNEIESGTDGEFVTDGKAARNKTWIYFMSTGRSGRSIVFYVVPIMNTVLKIMRKQKRKSQPHLTAGGSLSRHGLQCDIVAHAVLSYEIPKFYWKTWSLNAPISLREIVQCLNHCSKRKLHESAPERDDDQVAIQYNARNSAAVELITNASQLRKIGARERRRKGRGALNLLIASLAGNSERQSFVRCTVYARLPSR